jgi:transposase-like protein
VLGVTEENQRFEILALVMGDRKQADLWEGVFGDLAERGLDREAVELGIMDGLPGLEPTFRKFFPRAQTQRCQKHAKANACRAGVKEGAGVVREGSECHFLCTHGERSAGRLLQDQEQWGRPFPSAVQVIEKDLDSLLTFFQFDAT